MKCRLCGSEAHRERLSLPRVPTQPCTFVECNSCGLLQIANPSNARYAESTYTTKLPPHVPDLIATVQAIQDPGSALDVGCNDGAFMRALKEAGYQTVCGVEPGLTAERAVGEGPVFRCTLEEVPAEWGPFDTIFARHVVEHIDRLDGFFAKIRSLLKENGLLVVEVPKVSFLGGNPSPLWEQHLTYWQPHQLDDLLGRNGFEVLERREYAHGGGTMARVARKKHGRSQHPFQPTWLYHRMDHDTPDYRRRLQSVEGTFRRQGLPIVLYGDSHRSRVVLETCGITPDQTIDDAHSPGTPPENALVLLGVGETNEWKIRRRYPGRQYVSLFSAYPEIH